MGAKVFLVGALAVTAISGVALAEQQPSASGGNHVPRAPSFEALSLAKLRQVERRLDCSLEVSSSTPPPECVRLR